LALAKNASALARKGSTKLHPGQTTFETDFGYACGENILLTQTVAPSRT